MAEESEAHFIQEFRAACLRIDEIVRSWGHHSALLKLQLFAANDAIPPGASISTRRSIAAARAAPAIRRYRAELGTEIPTLEKAVEDAERAWNRSRATWGQAATREPQMVEETRGTMDRMHQAASFGATSTAQLRESLKTLGAELHLEEDVADASETQDQTIDLFKQIEALARLAMGVLDAAMGEAAP